MSKIFGSMTKSEILYEMSEGNPGAIDCMIRLLKHDEEAIFYIMFLDNMEIYGSKIYMIWNDCCNRDMTKFVETLQYLESGAVTKEEIHNNLNRVRAIPFI